MYGISHLTDADMKHTEPQICCKHHNTYLKFSAINRLCVLPRLKHVRYTEYHDTCIRLLLL